MNVNPALPVNVHLETSRSHRGFSLSLSLPFHGPAARLDCGVLNCCYVGENVPNLVPLPRTPDAMNAQGGSTYVPAVLGSEDSSVTESLYDVQNRQNLPELCFSFYSSNGRVTIITLSLELCMLVDVEYVPKKGIKLP